MEELGLQQGQLEYGEPRTIPISVFSERGADSQPHPYGTGIIHVYRKLYEQEFRFVSRDGDRVASMSTNGPDGGFIDAVLGGFPSAGGLSTLSKNYIDAFKPTEFSPSAAGFLQILQEGFRFPLYFTRHQLKRDYPSAGKDGPTLFVVDPDNPLDLIDFWNIRLYQPSVMPLSTRWLHQSQEFIAHFLKDGYRPLPGNSYGVMITPTIQFARSISKERAATLVDVAGLHAIEGCEWHFKLWYDRIWDDHTSDLVAQSEPVRVTASEADHELPITGEPELSIRFPDLSPDFVPQYERGSARWVNVLQLKSYGNDDRLALAFPSTFDERKSRRFRLGDASFISREGFVLPQRYPRAQNYFRIFSGTDAIIEWLRQQGVQAVPSDPGRIADQILISVGGFRGAPLLVDRSTIKLLDDMAKSVRRQVDGTVEEFEDRAASVDNWKALISRRLQTGYNRWVTLDAFITANVLKLGISIQCPNCMKKNWIGLATMREQLICERCLKQYPFPQGSLAFARTPWQYRVVGPFSVPDFARGAYATVLALRVFAGTLSTGDAELTYATGLEFTGVGASPIEVDFTCWYRRSTLFGRSEEPVLVFGEAKSFAAEGFGTSDIARMTNVAERFPGAFIVFATMKDELSDAEKTAIGELAMRGRTRMANKRPRSPVIVLTGTELFNDWHIGEAWKEKGGEHERFATPPSTRLDNLWTLADITQQLYLGLPDPDLELRQRRLPS
jgi:hypothetical protein